jgi:hypothetical protein
MNRLEGIVIFDIEDNKEVFRKKFAANEDCLSVNYINKSNLVVTGSGMSNLRVIDITDFNLLN